MAMLGTLALAEAIRLGAKERPQVREVLFGYHDAEGALVDIDHLRRCSCEQCVENERRIVGLGSCALGAALEATGTKAVVAEDCLEPLNELFPCLDRDAPADFNWCHPKAHSGTLRDAIVCLNDHQHWTREAIADWVGSL